MANLLKKITVKHVCPDLVAPTIGAQKELAVILGYAKSYEKKMTTFGESTAFHGDFKAVNVETGEEFRAGTCYLPEVAESMLRNAMDANTGVLEFGFKISIVGVKGRNEGEAGKYEYRVAPMMETSENDPLSQLEDRLKAKALPSPAKSAPAKSETAKKGGNK